MLHGEFLWNEAEGSILCLLSPANGTGESTGTVYLENQTMLKKLLFAGLLFAAAGVRAEEGQKVTSKVQKVTVFLNGAQVTRTASVSIAPGTSTLVFENVSPYVDEQSIQLHASGDFTILSVKFGRNYLRQQVKQKDVTDLQEKVKSLQSKIDQQNMIYAVDQEEENMLMKNQLVSGPNGSPDITKLKQALDFQTERLTAIREKKLELTKVVNALDSVKDKYQQQLNSITQNQGTETGSILVTVSSKTAVQTDFAVSYVTSNANWYATYDIKAKDTKSPVTIAYKANVIQNTGEDWKNIRLILCTGNPFINGTKPELNPYYLAFQPPVASGLMDRSNALNEVVVVGYGEKVRGRVSGLAVNTIEHQTSVEFAIDAPYSIPSDGKEYTVEINRSELNATYTYAVTPKLNTNAFLTASITDWSKCNFLPGQANLFFEGTYIGKSSLNTDNTSDTLRLSLGVDKGIVVTRKLQKEMTQKQSIGSNQKETRDWVIEIKNRKDQPVNLLVEDQVPVTQNTAIEVETQTLSGGNVDSNTGKVTWTMELKPLADKKLELKYQVKYPKNQMLAIN